MQQRVFAERMRHVNGDTARNIFKFMADPSIISFGGGSPAKETFPVEAIRDIVDEALANNAASVLQYGMTAGWLPLREAYIAHILAPKGVQAALPNVLMTTGGTQGFDLVTQAFVNPGDTVLVESPTFLASLTVLAKLGANVVAVETDEDGIVTDDLEQKARLYKPRLLYVIPTFQNPTGRTIPAARRRKIAELAAQYNFIVAEDDPYCDLRFSGQEQPPIKQFDTAGNVVLLHSFSKIVSPGIRVGSVTAEPDIIDKMMLVKQCADAHTANLSQVICAEFLRRGMLPPHLQAIMPIYKVRLDAMLSGIERYFPAGCAYTKPEGGLFVWVRLPADIDTMPLMERAAREIKVAFVPGAPFCVDPAAGRNCLRLNFSSSTPEVIEEGMRRLGEFLSTVCE